MYREITTIFWMLRIKYCHGIFSFFFQTGISQMKHLRNPALPADIDNGVEVPKIRHVHETRNIVGAEMAIPDRNAVVHMKQEGNGIDDEAGDVPWEEFNESGYIDKTRVSSGGDAYARNKFNQVASDNTKSNRDVPDTRQSQ